MTILVFGLELIVKCMAFCRTFLYECLTSIGILKHLRGWNLQMFVHIFVHSSSESYIKYVVVISAFLKNYADFTYPTPKKLMFIRNTLHFEIAKFVRENFFYGNNELQPQGFRQFF